MRGLRLGIVGVLVALAIAIIGPASAQEFVEGGEPGIRIVLGGVDLDSATLPRGAIDVDPSGSLDLNISLAAPPETVWDIREFRISVLLQGAGSTPPDALVRRSPAEARIPPGFTVFVNRSFSLEAIKPLGAGLFLMRAEVIDAQQAELYESEFYVHVQGNPFLTVAGATATVASVATGYGLWQIVRDLKEAYDARQRHKKHERESRAGRYAAMAITASDGLEGAIDIAAGFDKDADRIWKRRILAWTATGLGLGGVAVSWAQFLGYVPVNLATTLLSGAATAIVFLTMAIVLLTMHRRLRARLAARKARRVPVQEGAADAPEAEPQAPVRVE